MQIVIDIPNKDIPKHQEVIDIRLHFIDGHIVDADGCGFVELPKEHGRLIDADALEYDITSLESDSDVQLECIDKQDIADAPTIIEADTESEG